ncbi:toprim domain-containing protein, partial [Chloroflexota bacterium]
GVDRASGDIRKQDMAVIVEGYIDVITAHQNSICNVVASMGTSITETQVTTLKKLTKNLVLALDADAAGEEAMLRGAGYENTLGSEVKVILLPAGRDPDDVIKEDAGTWQQLVKDATPIIDYTFNIVTAKLDLSTPRDKSLAVERLLPVISDMKDTVRQAHYLQKLAHLVNMNVRNLESTLSNIKPRQGAYKAKSPKQEAVSRALRPLVSKPQEEYCLTLLLQHPELKAESESLLPEYFENSINREIYTAWQDSDDQKSLKEKLDIAIHEYLDSLLNMNLPPAMTEQKFKQCLLRLQEDFLKGIEARNAEILTSESEIGGTEAELAKLEEQGIETSSQLAEVHKRQRQPETRR